MRTRRWPWLVVISTMIALHPGTGEAADVAAELPIAIQRTLEFATPVLDSNGRSVPTEPLAEFYTARQDRPIWFDAGALNDRGRELMDVLARADRDGLDPHAYAVGDIPASTTAAARIAISELALSDALVRYARDIRLGRATPETERLPRFAPEPIASPAQTLGGAAETQDLRGYLAGLAPTDPLYRGLRSVLERYRTIAAAGGWPGVGSGPTLAPGSSGPRVALLRQRLVTTGDLAADTPAKSPGMFDEALHGAVRRFQARHGLPVDGRVGPATVAALDVPADARIHQILANLERARWLPADLGDRYVLVNMAAFELDVVEAGRQVMDMRVVVGERDKATPAFSDLISYIEINPYWNLPRSIAIKEKLPQLRRNPAALAAQNIRVLGPGGEQIDPATIDWSAVGNNFPYRLRQDPGARNALGRIKFMFPNPYDIYLHDTPSRALFNRHVRAFSHGCIRVEKPMELAEFLLNRNGSWPEDRIQNIIDSGRNRAVTLDPPVPVHLVYLTAWLATDGTVQFRDDLYNRDARLVAALDAPGE